MDIKNAITTDIYTWDQVRHDVMIVNPSLAEAIDAFDPGDSHKLIRARYAFGDNILNRGKFFLPNEKGKLHPLNESPHHSDLLNYTSTIPLGIVLNNSIELYLNVGDRIIPFTHFKAGKMFSLWTAYEKQLSAHLGRVWNITAGSRSLKFLPKISDKGCYNRVKREFCLRTNAPNNLSGQWDTFVELANADNFPNPWYVDVLFFSKEWLAHNQPGQNNHFEHHLLNIIWNETAFLRNQIVVDFAFSSAITKKNLKPSAYIKDTVKHLFNIGIKAYPAFRVATDDLPGPIESFQDIFANIYGLSYAPTMVYASAVSSLQDSPPSYYSLQFPSLLDFSPHSRKATSKYEDLREIKTIMAGVQDFILENSLGLDSTPVYEWANKIDYQYYHTNEDRFGENILPTKSIIDNDITLQSIARTYPTLDFCDTSPFLRGCVQIIHK